MLSAADRERRQNIIEACRSMNALGINQGTSGNISLRDGEGFLITPTSMPYDDMQPEDIIAMRFDRTVVGNGRPSTEWRFHLDILRERPDVNAIVHAHPIYSTTLAILERDIPPLHYMVCAAGGDNIRCAPYATFGTQDLSDNAIDGAEGPESLPACPSRHDRGRRRPEERDVARRRGRKPRSSVSQLPAARPRAAVADARRGRQRGRADRQLRAPFRAEIKTEAPAHRCEGNRDLSGPAALSGRGRPELEPPGRNQAQSQEERRAERTFEPELYAFPRRKRGDRRRRQSVAINQRGRADRTDGPAWNILKACLRALKSVADRIRVREGMSRPPIRFW